MKKKGNMRKIVLAAICVLTAPFAFAQTSTTTTQTTNTEPVTTESTTTTTYTAGTVDTYEAGKTVIVKDEHGGPVRFAIGTAARIVDGAGKIVTAPLRSGEKVRVYYTGNGDTRTVERVVVEE